MVTWLEHVARWKDCTRCGLCEQRDRICLARAGVVGGATTGGTLPCDVLFVGEAPGASEDAIGLPFCIRADHRILMGDLTWKALGDVKTGETIIAPDESGTDVDSGSASGRDARRWRVATVTNTIHSQRQCVKLITEKGTLTITPDHRVLTAYPNCRKARKWLRVDQLMVGRHRSSCLATVFLPWIKDESYKSGWVGGFLDGEGNVPKPSSGVRRKASVGFAQNSGQTCEQAKQYLRDLGYECSIDEVSTSNNEKVRVLGGFRKVVELLGRTRPERLITNFVRWIEQRAPRCYSVQPSRVLEIDNRTRGLQDVVDITTTTGTFVCEGFIVHNCGPAGDLMQQVIERSLPPGTTYALTNLVCCFPRDAKARGENEPEYDEILACRPRLLEFVAIARPRLVVRVGRLAGDFLQHDARGLVCGAAVEDITHPASVLKRTMPLAQKGMAVQKMVVTVRSAFENLV